MWRSGLIQLPLMLLPWRLRRRLLRMLLQYDIEPTARIGFSVVLAKASFTMGAGSSIGHMTVARGMDRIVMGRGARIGNLNWIYAIPRSDPCLSHEPTRRIELILDDHAAITHRHTVDCSNTIYLGRGALVAGNRTQIVTHGLSTRKLWGPHTRPISIGQGSLVGTGCIVLGGARLPDYSALGAGSTLRQAFSETHRVYSGVPAQRVDSIPVDSPFFIRHDMES